jgi:phenylpropionate dioxygenase-like ring-hydroxylating dioxygenase large terminal subunit
LLPKGKIFFPGTLSCSYHGWTYNSQGECLAALAEGPDCKPFNVKIKSYSVKERFGIVWLFAGDIKAPPLDEDLPPALLQDGIHVQFRLWDWDCNWRVFTENAPDMLHAYIAHRTSLNMLFRKLPAYGVTFTEPLPDAKGLYARAKGSGMQAHYPGLGAFPRRYWWRVLGARKGGTPGAEIRMPGYILVFGWEPFFQFRVVNMQWPTPIDEQRTRILNLNITYPANAAEKLLLKLWYNSYYIHMHRQFLEQDRWLIEGQTYRNPEKLSGSDIAVIDWRRFAAKIARRPVGGLGNYEVKEPPAQTKKDEIESPVIS